MAGPNGHALEFSTVSWPLVLAVLLSNLSASEHYQLIELSVGVRE